HVLCSPDRCPLHRDGCGLVTAIIPGQKGTYHHLQTVSRHYSRNRVRDNLLTPPHRSEGVFSFAEEHHVGMLISKPLGQGLLTGTHRTNAPRAFGEGDHRLRKRWFQPDAIEIINAGLDSVSAIVGPHTEDLIRIALWGCLDRSPHAVALVGFTTPDQVAMNLGSLSPRPDAAEIAEAREIMAGIQARLDAAGETILMT
ncbi:MAG TPA: aldo/keto reductase, partial [Pseudonocardiaceae bacterium]